MTASPSAVLLSLTTVVQCPVVGVDTGGRKYDRPHRRLVNLLMVGGSIYRFFLAMDPAELPWAAEPPALG